MSKEERLDRRDFMIASITTAGASAALAVTAGAANSQSAATTSADPASGTVYTGDTMQGKNVVSALDVNDLKPGKKHLLYFQGVQMPTGQHWYVSVTVAKGAKPGNMSRHSPAGQGSSITPQTGGVEGCYPAQ
jgi:uncharacterized protein